MPESLEDVYQVYIKRMKLGNKARFPPLSRVLSTLTENRLVIEPT